MNELLLQQRRSRGKIFAMLIAVLAVAMGLTIVGYYAEYRAYPWTTYPSTLHVCGRDFQPAGGPETREAVTEQGYHLIRHGDAPGWLNREQLWTFDSVDGQAAEALPGDCHVVLWVRGGSNSFKPYELEGGP